MIFSELRAPLFRGRADPNGYLYLYRNTKKTVAMASKKCYKLSFPTKLKDGHSSMRRLFAHIKEALNADRKHET